MISRHITRLPENDNYRRLANYIADANHRGEKALMSWCAGCWAEDDYQLAIHEVEAVQSMNTRSSKEKTYHLVVSFRPEDEAKLTPEVFKEIELEFAKALGFDEHQRHCGVHRNTANIHLHIAYSEIHPVRRTRHEPFRDFATRDRLCRQLEKRYGLTPENGRDLAEKVSKNDRAMSFESRTGQESLFSYAQRHKPAIMNDLATVKTWADCHQVFHKYGLVIKPHGNGLVIRDLSGGSSIKASDLDRNLSKGKLEKKLGQFKALDADLMRSPASEFTYSSAPLQQGAGRDDLYAEYRRAMAERRAETAKVKDQEDRLYKVLRQGWDTKLTEMKSLPMLRNHRQKVRREFEARKKAELTGLRELIKQEKDDVRARYPFTCWNQFLQHQARQGNETALAVLRSRRTKSTTQSQPQYVPYGSDNNNVLTAVAQMREILAGDATSFQKAPELKYNLDAKGTLIFSLPNGAVIRDNGQQITFSAHSEMAKNLAAKLAKARWGQSVAVQDNIISPCMSPQAQQHHETARPAKGMER